MQQVRRACASTARPFAAVRPWVSYSTPSLVPASPRSTRRSRKLRGGMGAVAIDPDADVFDDGSVLGLAKVGRAGQQRHAAVGVENQALEETVAEAVVAGQPVHALLARRAAWHRGRVPPSRAASSRAARRIRRVRNAAPSASVRDGDRREQPAVVRLAEMGGAAVGIEALRVGIGAEAERAAATPAAAAARRYSR